MVNQFGISQSKKDHLFFYRQTLACWILLDDIMITEGTVRVFVELRKYLGKQFQTKDIEAVKYFLDIKVTQDKQDSVISQRKYVLDILTGMMQTKGATSSMNPGIKLLPNEWILVTDPEQYRRLVGELNYLTVMTRSSIFFDVSVVGRFMAPARVPY